VPTYAQTCRLMIQYLPCMVPRGPQRCSRPQRRLLKFVHDACGPDIGSVTFPTFKTLLLSMNRFSSISVAVICLGIFVTGDVANAQAGIAQILYNLAIAVAEVNSF
jgi:hypothetical protein